MNQQLEYSDNLVQIENDMYIDIKSVINNTKQSLAIQVNYTLVLSYWNIGKIINEKILQNERATYGKYILENLALRLALEYGDGFSKANLTRMMNFQNIFVDYAIVATLSQQFSWSHFVEFIKLEDTLKREFYITMCNNEKWSVRTLRERISSMLFERTALSTKTRGLYMQGITNSITQWWNGSPQASQDHASSKKSTKKMEEVQQNYLQKEFLALGLEIVKRNLQGSQKDWSVLMMKMVNRI